MRQNHPLPLFDPAGVFWRVNREAVLLLGGGAALLLQIAHPLVAAGVADHSGFRQAPVRRLVRTLTRMREMIHADRPTALAAARRVNQVHATIVGTLADPTPAFAAGTPYRANDPALLLWVQATLVETALRTYEAFFPALSVDERMRYYEESKTIGQLLGLATSEMPADYPAFHRYFDAMTIGPELHVTPTCAELAEHIVHPPVFWFPRIAGDALAIATAALLPAPVRERYGLSWGRRQQRIWEAARRAIRRTLPYVPRTLRVSKQARRSERR